MEEIDYFLLKVGGGGVIQDLYYLCRCVVIDYLVYEY